MAAAQTSAPAAPHATPGKLEDQAASAALYVTKPERSAAPTSQYLDKDGKLSSAGAAASLKYAKPADLPSFPSSGLNLSSAGAAASLANANQKAFEHWKPDALPAAEKAAYLAKDYHADPLWEPEMSAPASRAALLAHRDGGNVNLWKPEESEYGNSAAGQAMRKTGLNPTVDRSVPPDASHRALLAATGAMSGSRRRAGSAPIKPVARQDTPAMTAATKSHGTARGPSAASESMDPAMDASRIHNIAKSNINREMYTSHPPVSIEVEEKNRQTTLRASAIAMAQQMYQIQQPAIDEAAGAGRPDSHYAARKVHGRRLSEVSNSTLDEPTSYPQYSNLQEAAQKLATERLAKLHDEHQAYRNYYGQTSPPRSRLSIRGKMRRRASSDGEAEMLDEERSRKIRSEMSLFQDKLAAVDAKKRQTDRNALLAAAQRNVNTKMHNMDEKVFAETGKASPAMMQEWETKAKERAQADSDARMANHGKVHIGGGKYLDQSEVDAVAKSRIQPTLDEINEKVEQHRARDEELRLEQEEKKRLAETEKTRAAELKADEKRAKETEKQEQKARKEEEKAKKAEDKRAQKEEKRRSKDNKTKDAIVGEGAKGGGTAATEPPTLDEIPKTDPIAAEEATDDGPGPEISGTDEVTGTVPLDSDRAIAPIVIVANKPDTEPVTEPVTESTTEHTTETPLTTTTIIGGTVQPTPAPASPTKADSKVKYWFKQTFARRISKPTSPKDLDTAADDAGDKDKKTSGFIGGAALTGASVGGSGSTTSPTSLEARNRADSEREVALAGKSKDSTATGGDLYGASNDEAEAAKVSPPLHSERRGSKSPSISSLSSEDEPEATTASRGGGKLKKRRGRLGIRDRILGKTTTKESKDSADGDEEFEEARDTFEEEKLAPPPKLSTVVQGGESQGRVSASPVRDSKFSEDL